MKLSEQLFVASTFFFVLFGYNLLSYEPFTFASADPGWMVTAVQSLAEDGDIDLRNQLGGDPQRAEDQVARGVRGEWYPVHEPLIVFLTLPFYLLFGINGCLVFNFLTSWALALLCYALCRARYPSAAALAAAGFAVCGTIVQRYSYSYSVDVLGAMFAAGAALSYLQRRFSLCGMLLGLSVAARLGNAAALPAFALALILSPRGFDKKALGALVLGGAPIAALWLLGNHYMFGNILATSYSNWAPAAGGELIVSSQFSLFEVPTAARVLSLLLDPKTGLFAGFALMPLALLLGLPLLWSRERDAALLTASMLICYLLFFSFYSASDRTSGGNRYLLALVPLLALCLAAAIERCLTPSKAMDEAAI